MWPWWQLIQAVLAFGGIGIVSAVTIYAVDLRNTTHHISESVASIKIEMQKMTSEIEAELSRATLIADKKRCSMNQRVIIDSPKNNETISQSKFELNGYIDPLWDCRYVWALIRDMSRDIPYYLITDQAQVRVDGQWSLQGRFDDIGIAAKAEIRVRLTSTPDQLRVLSVLPHPLMIGAYSDAVLVNRGP